MTKKSMGREVLFHINLAGRVFIVIKDSKTILHTVPTSHSAYSYLPSHKSVVAWVKCNYFNLEAQQNNRLGMFKDLARAHKTFEVKLVSPHNTFL